MPMPSSIPGVNTNEERPKKALDLHPTPLPGNWPGNRLEYHPDSKHNRYWRMGDVVVADINESCNRALYGSNWMVYAGQSLLLLYH